MPCFEIPIEISTSSEVSVNETRSEEMNSPIGIQKPSWKQWIGGLAAASIMFHPSIDTIWVNKFDFDIINMIIIVLVIIGAILGAVLAETFGRKRTLLAAVIFVIPRLICVICRGRKWVWIVNFVVEFGWGIACAVVPLYISEIACTNNRGNLMVLPLLVGSIGSFILTTHRAFMEQFEWSETVDTVVHSIFLLASALFHVVILALFPDTPHYLNSKKRYQEVADSLAFFRGISHVKIQEDANDIPMNTQISNKRPGKINEIVRSENWRSLAIIFSLIVIRWVGGQSRNEEMISHFAYSIGRIWALFGVAGVQLIFAIFVLLAIGLLERKITLLLVIFVCFVAAIAGIDYFMLNSEIKLFLSLVQHLGYFILMGVGLAYTGEFFSTNVRATACAVILSFDILIRNVILMLINHFPPAMYYVGAGTLFVAFFIVLIFFPKTNKVADFHIAIETSTV